MFCGRLIAYDSTDVLVLDTVALSWTNAATISDPLFDSGVRRAWYASAVYNDKVS